MLLLIPQNNNIPGRIAGYQLKMLTAFFIFIAAGTIPLSSSSSCYDSRGQPVACSPPKIDNILNGNTPVATSTCGEGAMERTCQRGGLHCSVCGDGDSSLHPPEHITDSDPLTYWLSPPYSSLINGSGGMNVNISFNLNKTFIIDEIKLLFYSPRPHSFSLHVSSDFGDTYNPLRYYSLSCLDTYGVEEERGEREGARCTSNGVGLIPLAGGMVVYRSESLPLSVTNIQIRLHKLVLLPDIETWNQLVLDSYYYALSSVEISGYCDCNGHASSCMKDPNEYYNCNCQHNTTGIDCQTCLPSRNDLPWQPATNENTVIECRNCSGLCGCQEGVGGDKCETCLPGYYNNSGSCTRCNCNSNGSNGCDSDTGECYCLTGYSGIECELCPDGTHNINDGCIDCPSCYDNISIAYNTTLNSLQSLTEAIINSSTSKRIHPSLTNTVLSLQSNLLNLKELLINLTSRQMQLFSNLSETNSELVETEEEVNIFANFIKEIEMSAKLIRENREMNDELISNITQQLLLIETLLKVNATEHLQTSLNITKRIDMVISQLTSISIEAEAAANEQSITVRELVREGLALSDNTTDLLQLINELLDIENSTLELLKGLNDCSTSNLHNLVAEGEIKLSQVINDTVAVLEAAMSVYDEVESIKFMERGRELLAQSLQLLMTAGKTYNETVNVSIANNELRETFNVLLKEGQDLLSTASYLNNTARDILAREREALSSANASLSEGERIIKEAEEVLKQVEEELARALSYAERLNRLRLLVERAEEDSNITLSLAIERRRKINELSDIILATESVLLRTIETLDTINDALNSTNATASISHSEATELQQDIKLIQLEETESKLRELGERGEKDRQLLQKTSTGLNAAVNTAVRTNDNIETLSVQVKQVEERINSISFVDSEALNSLDAAISAAEAACNTTGMELEELKSEILVLESMSGNLTDKYVNLQLHRDLLKDMRDNLDTLDCENEFQ